MCRRRFAFPFAILALASCSDAASSDPDALDGATGGGRGGSAGSLSSGGKPHFGGAAGSSAGAAIAGSAAAAQAGSGGNGEGGEDGETYPGLKGPKGKTPNVAYPSSLIGLPRDEWQKGLISPTLESQHHNQPSIVNGYLQLTGKARFSTYDISDPKKPILISEAVSPDNCKTCGEKNEGEAEGHQVSFASYGDQLYTVTISGKGVDIWNITVPAKPSHVKAVHLEGIDYGDFTNAVWGVYWQGSTIYAGGTNTGLHIIDATKPSEAKVVKRIPTSSFGSVSAGPVYAVGNILVVTTPKESGGIATLDISNPHDPKVLDAISAAKSYIGAFYRHHVYLQGPLRVWDVLTDPTTIGKADAPLSTLTTPASEYMSFSDGFMFLGLLRPDPGVLKIDVRDVKKMQTKNRIWGRMNLDGNDDQFTFAVGNLVVMSDDQLQGGGKGYVGTVIGIHAAEPDSTPPEVDTIIPKSGAKNVALSARVGISFTDNLEFTTVNPESFIVRPVGGAPVRGTWGLYMGVLNFDPAEDLAPNTTYEVVLPEGGIADCVRNTLAAEFKSTFTTR